MWRRVSWTGTTLTPYPEELNRQLISRIAAFHLAPTSINRQNLVREGIPDERVFVTGNTGLDALQFAAALDVAFENDALRAMIDARTPYVVVTAHRRENWGGGLARIAEGIGRLAAMHPAIRFAVPLHPNPLVRQELGDPLATHANIVVTEPLAYAQFARLMAGAALIVTDSGGIQEEAPASESRCWSLATARSGAKGSLPARWCSWGCTRPSRRCGRADACGAVGPPARPCRQPVRRRPSRHANGGRARVSGRHRPGA